MRCSCRKCGTYMVQEEYGLQSGCKCPNCGEMCRDCMGSVQQPMSSEELSAKYAVAAVTYTDTISDERFEELKEETAVTDWRKLL